MILREVAFPGRFGVYAVCLGPDGGCQLEKFLLDHRGSHPRSIDRINVAMKEITPQFGPPFEDEDNDLERAAKIAKRLRDGACEFKAQEKRTGQFGGPKRAPRVMFFQDQRWVICTHGFMKQVPPVSSREQDSHIEECLRVRALYLREKASKIAPVVRKGWAL